MLLPPGTIPLDGIHGGIRHRTDGGVLPPAFPAESAFSKRYSFSCCGVTRLSPVVGALVIFRGVFYLLPLGVLAVILGMYERGVRREKAGSGAFGISQWGRGLSPIFSAS